MDVFLIKGLLITFQFGIQTKPLNVPNPCPFFYFETARSHASVLEEFDGDLVQAPGMENAWVKDPGKSSA